MGLSLRCSLAQNVSAVQRLSSLYCPWRWATSAVCCAITKFTRSAESLIFVELLPTIVRPSNMASNPTVLAPATMNLSGLTAMSR